MGNDNVIHVNDENWEKEVIQSQIPVLVDFWAEWCGPCRMIAPVLDEIASEAVGKLKVAKVNVDQNHKLATQFGIRSIPTLLVFKEGKVQEQMIGALSKAALKNKISAYLTQ